jgi:hypothetical protein
MVVADAPRGLGLSENLGGLRILVVLRGLDGKPAITSAKVIKPIAMM